MSQRRRVVKQPKRLIHEIGPSSQEPEQSKKRKFTRETQYPSHVRKHLNDYQSLCVRYEDLLVKAPDLSGPALDPAYIQATKDLGDMHAMISDFGRQFEKKLASYEDSCERLERANRQRPDWWQHINLFSPSTWLITNSCAFLMSC
ncbi:hypothetical protein P153DRAFT_51084 [Dothidotthia symphoricarpi CBS 119687]|uniref:Uncharacterized protein n=1 Tax=Dothidotthia symphoricarpi CBS 119687 TaxID=1392245 RepID=A0A6A6A9J9_9PLEO|nr:uncharacterized protein P153DRAFT_51084 [Dothidotthia symphoricarpi CBS 119687]KAF2127518.1 hypothetical protein P153DRAFT_51084 [Dothidotthia symphoricarpi CBS 119687]